MSFTKITGPGIHTLSNIVSHNLKSSGIITAVNGNLSGWLAVGQTASFGGNVSIGGTLTYDDVTNVESVGIITAKAGIHVGAGGTIIHALSEDNGKVGIQTNDPQVALHVFDGASGFRLERKGTNIGYLGVAISHGTPVGANNYGSAYFTLSRTTGDYVFKSSTNEIMRLLGDSGRLGIGTDNPATKLDVKDGDITIRNGAEHNAIRTTPDGKLQFLRNAASNNTVSVTIDDANGNVGIGTTVPSALLHVAKYTYDQPDNENFFRIKLQDQGGVMNDVGIGQVASGSLSFNNTASGRFTFHNGTNGEVFRIESGNSSGGGVGISTAGGTITPAGNALLIRAGSTVGTNKGHIMLTGDGATVGEGPQIVFSESGSGSNFAGGSIGFERRSDNSQGDLIFGTRGTSGNANTTTTERLRILSSGEIGIGITNPVKTGIQNLVKVLQIDGGDGAEIILGNSQSSNVAANHIGAIAFKNIDDSVSAAPNYAGIRCNATDTVGNMNLKFYAGSTAFESDIPHMTIISSGKIGIGTYAPSDKLSIYAAPNSLVFGAKDTTRGNHIFQLLADDSAGNGELRLYRNSGSGNHEHTVEIASQGNSYFLQGNIGIGTNNISQPITIRRSSVDQSEFGVRFQFEDLTGPTQTSSALLVGSYGLKLKNYNSSRNFLFETGKVGIGTDTPGKSLQIYSSTPAVRLTDTDTAGPLHCDIESVSGDLYLNTGSVHRDVIISSTGSSERENEIIRFTGDGQIKFDGKTLSQRNLLTGETGALIYNSDGKIFQYYDGSGWISLNTTNQIVATGGNSVTTSGGYRIHDFAGSGTFTITSGVGEVEVLVVGGGGSEGGDTSGCHAGGGGGGGGVVYKKMNMSAGQYPITIGAGGLWRGNGENTVFGTGTDHQITALGGGAGGPTLTGNGNAGGSGGGASRHTTTNLGGVAQQPGTTDGGFGNRGGDLGSNTYTGGGGGAGGAGQDGDAANAGRGGAGKQFTQFGVNIYFGAGGNAQGSHTSEGQTPTSTNGAGNTGAGGGGSVGGSNRSSGGSGRVMIRYPAAT